MNKNTANKLWMDLYFGISPLCFSLARDGSDYAIIFKPTKEKVLTFEEGVNLAKKHNLIKVKK